MSRETRALLRKHSQSVMVKHFACLIHFCSCLSTLKLEKKGHVVFQLKRMKLFMEHFFAKATCEPSPGSKCFLNSKAHTRLVFSCTMHNSPLSRRQYFPSGLFPLPCFNRPLGVRDGSLSPQPGSQSCLKSTCKQFGSQADFEVNYPETHLFFKFKRSFYEVEASKVALGLSLQFYKDCGSQLATLHGINFLRLSGKDIRSKLA